MTSIDTLARTLPTLPRDALTRLFDRRDLPEWAGPGYGAAQSDSEHVAAALLTAASVRRGMEFLDTGHKDVLVALAQLAVEEHGAPPAAPATHDWGPPVAPAFDPADRSVNRAAAVRRLAAAAGCGEGEMSAVLDELAAQALVLPTGRGRVTVPGTLHRLGGELSGLGRPARLLLDEAYNAPEMHQVAETLGGRGRTRADSADAVVERLADAAFLRTVLADAPPEARDLLERLVAGPPLLATHCFVSRYGDLMDRRFISPGYRRPGERFTFRTSGSGDPGTDWLAAHGLVLPSGHDLAEMPAEVGRALRDGDGLRLRMSPPPLPRTEPLSAGASGARAAKVPADSATGWLARARSTAGAAAREAELVLTALAARPATVRKAGGLGVREVQRIAKETGVAEPYARLWIDLAANAGLFDQADADESGSAKAPARRGRSRRPAPEPAQVLLPTARYDTWAGAAPAARLLPLIATWATCPETFTYWPADSTSAPIALVTPDDEISSRLRHGLLAALARLPDGEHVPLATASERDALLAPAAWHCPTVESLHHYTDGDELLAAQLTEADHLGVTAQGRLTPLGHTVLGLLDADAAVHFPAVPGTGADLTGRPWLRDAVDALAECLAENLPAPHTTARFQADLTVTVLGQPAAELATLLNTTGERESEGHAVVWRIGPASVRRALDSGRDADELVSALSAVAEAGTPLPQPLTYLIKDVARTHGRLRVVRSACCLRSDDEHLLTEIAAARPLAKLGLRRIAPTVLISTATPDTTLAALRAAGYAPVLEAETGSTVVELAPRRRAEDRLPALDTPDPRPARTQRTGTIAAARTPVELSAALTRSDRPTG